MGLQWLVPPAATAQLKRLTFEELDENGHFSKNLQVYDASIVLSESNYSNQTIHAGRVHLFSRDGGDWSHTDILTEPDLPDYANFGQELALTSTDLAISAPGIRQGAVFMYTLQEDVWNRQQTLTMPAEVYKEGLHVRFGEDVQISDQWLAISAPGYHGGADPLIRTGAVFVYKKEGESWVFRQLLLPVETSRSIQFAKDIDMSDGYLAVTAPKGDGGSSNSGAVYLYRLDGEAWIPEYTFIDPLSRGHELFGADVELHGNTLVIGVPMYTHDEDTGPVGAAHIFQRIDNTWVRTALITSSDGKRNDMFGATIAIEDGTVVISSPRFDHPYKRDMGKVYVFQVEDGFWTETDALIPPEEDRQEHMMFGAALSMHQSQLVISAHLTDNLLEDSGVAYVTKLNSTVSSKDIEKNSVNVFISPNPATDHLELHVRDEQISDLQFHCYGQDGKLVQLKRLNEPGSSESIEFDISALSPGVYFMHISGSARDMICKWIKL